MVSRFRVEEQLSGVQSGRADVRTDGGVDMANARPVGLYIHTWNIEEGLPRPVAAVVW